ncbi:MAG: DNA topoisomerase IV subunit A [Alphaproteobacteria bacterium]|nr:DNA topoisomerase IV subunit A [Alphaproteobacteria bacterium]
MAKKSNTSVESKVIDQPMGDILSERYLSYALSTIMNRALPDVRDGMKPVHRRLLFAMSQLNLKHDAPPKKSARVVGDVIGKYHPHGDSSVYDAMVRLAQDFAVRYPMVDGQGNFGNIDGDNAAAMRYTEARLTRVAQLMLEGIAEDAVDFRPTYDGSESEPVVLPGAFPNILANGSSGIAVGMATNIPPFNVSELCEASLAMLEGDVDAKALAKIIKGPDFPTGGILIEPKANIINAYETGKGAFRVRAKWEREDLQRGTYQIVVTEIPYQVQKSKLIEKIAELINNKKVPLLDDVRDESAEDIRIVLVPRSGNVEAELLMEALFRVTDLETRFSMNMNVLTLGDTGALTPRVLPLKEVLQAWLDHQQVVLVRRSRFRLDKVLHRLEILEGLLIVYLNVDKVIKIIRTKDKPKEELMKEFKLTEVQAEAILNMRLRALNKLQEIELKDEHNDLSKERDELEKLIKSEARQWTVIKKQIKGLQEEFGPQTFLGKRRTKIGKALEPVDLEQLEESMIEKEPITVICSAKGWIKAMRGHDLDTKSIKYKDGDREKFILQGMTTDKFLVFGSNGRFYTMAGDKLPPGRGFGEPLRLMVDLPNDADIVDMEVYDASARMVVAADDGRGFIVKMEDCLAQTKNGKQILNVGGKVEAKMCKVVAEDHDHIAVMGKNRKMIVFELEQIPEMAKGKGVILQRYKDGGLGDFKTFKWDDGLTYKYGTGETLVPDLNPWLGERAQAGRLPPNGFPKSNKFG